MADDKDTDKSEKGSEQKPAEKPVDKPVIVPTNRPIFKGLKEDGIEFPEKPTKDGSSDQ